MNPAGPSLICHLVVSPCADAIEFYKQAFGLEEVSRQTMPDGKIIHAEVRLGSTSLYLVDEFDQGGSVKSPKTLGGTTVMANLLVADADAACQRAADAGATVLMPVADTFWGARYGQVEDPFGHRWAFNQQVSQPSQAEMTAALAADSPH